MEAETTTIPALDARKAAWRDSLPVYGTTSETGDAKISGLVKQPTAQAAAPRANLPIYATIPEWCRISGMGKSMTYEELGRGNLRARKLGARTLIDVAHGLAWLDSLPAATIRPHGGKRAA